MVFRKYLYNFNKQAIKKFKLFFYTYIIIIKPPTAPENPQRQNTVDIRNLPMLKLHWF